VENGFEEPLVIGNKDDKLEFTFNSKAMNAILSGLIEYEFIKVMHYTTAKNMWDKQKNIHEGDYKVNLAKLQVYKMQSESLRINEDEDLAKFFLRVDKIVNVMEGLGKEDKESTLVQEVLRSLNVKFNPKVSKIEEISNIEELKMDQLLSSLTTYEIRITKGKSTTRDATFKSKRTLGD